jgi:hypothetical protein
MLQASQHRMCMVAIATHPKGYRIHACAVLMRYTTDKNQPTPARYHISGHNFILDITLSYGSVIGNASDIVGQTSSSLSYCSMIWIIGLCGGQPLLCRCRLMTRTILAVAIPHTPMCGVAIGLISTASVLIPQSRCWLGRDFSHWPESAQCSNLAQEIGLKIPLDSLQLTIAVSTGQTPLLYPIRHNHSSIGKWSWLKTTRSAGLLPFRSGSVIASSNQLPQLMLQWIC